MNIPIKAIPFHIDSELRKALQYHQSGQLEKAEGIYKRILEINPNHSDSLHLLGIIAHQVGKIDLSINLINKAIQSNPESPLYYLNLGSVFKKQGKLSEAISSLKKALELQPDCAEAYNDMGNAFKQQGKLSEAISSYEEAVQLKPDFAEAYYNMGNAFKEQGNLSEAISGYKKAVQLKPDYAEAYNNMGNVFKEQRNLSEAISGYEKAVQLKPDYAEAYNNMGAAFSDQGKLSEAISGYEKAVQLKPDYAEAYNNMGAAFRQQGKLSEAISYYEKGLQLRPDCGEIYNNMGVAFEEQGKLSEAISYYEKALKLRPDFAVAHSNLLFSLHYHDSIDPVELFSQHQQWAARHASPLATTIQPHLNDRSPDRRLRVGYVSPDFSMHSVAHFIEAVLASHDCSAFEIFCYSDVACPDAVTDRLKSLATCWRDIFGMPDKQVAGLIHNDQIDILVDLAGHTAYNRMLLFARKPAPVQVTYLGYPNTTGLTTMDYRITDPWADPPGRTDHLYTEKLVRLPHGFLCYKPPEETPVVAKLPAKDSDSITFGSFNNSTKISPEVVMVWSKILSSVSNSQLILKSKSLSDAGTQQLLREMFVQNGVSPGRIKFVGRIPSLFKHLELYNSIDIGLDTFPYNGTTTTCEAVWMGVPVIVLAGRTHVSRVGVSLLSNIGLTDLIAESTEAYLEKAVKLAGDLKRLEKLRANLRDRMSNSALTDAHRFTTALEEGYRKMWRHWCDRSIKSNSFYVETFNPLSEATVTDPQLLIEKHEAATLHNILGDRLDQEGYEQNSDLSQEDQSVSSQPTDRCLTVRIKGDIEVCLPPSIQLLTPYVLLEQEDWFESEIEFVRHMLKPGMRVIDIGASYGLYTLTMAKAVDENGQVWAFEPASTTAGYLQQSIRRNQMANVELIQGGLSNHEGKAELRLNPNSELNKLIHEPEKHEVYESIRLLRLDDCLAKYGWRDIAFVKLDAEGEESNIIKGGSQFLSSQSPLIMFEVKHGQELNLGLIKELVDYGYKTYSLIPGLNLLTPFDLAETLDPYQLNLFCCKKNRAHLLEKYGLLVNSSPDVSTWPATEAELWVKYLSGLPYTKKVIQRWVSSSHNRAIPGWDRYQKALNYYVWAHSETASPASRYACLQESLSILSTLLDTQANFCRLQTLARVTWEMGKRQITLQALGLLVDIFQYEQQLDLSEPFLPVANRFELLDPGGNLRTWCLASILEQRVKLDHFSSYYTGKASLADLEILNSLGFQGAEMERRRQLIRMRYGMQNGPQLSPILSSKTQNNLNSEFWGGYSNQIVS